MLDGELNTFFLFGALTLYSFVYGASWSIAAVRLRVDAGLFLIVLTSIGKRELTRTTADH